jgi:predicted DsbA family dithiol-disulfide isomerase
MAVQLKIDFVSDVVCPWCVIGLRGLEEGLKRAADAVKAEITLQPYELNPNMPPEGQDVIEHITQKYGAAAAAQSASNREMMGQRFAAVGFTYNTSELGRLYNTFDAHRLLHWAKTQGRQLELKTALFKANFTDRKNIADRDVLVEVADSAGLDGKQAREVLDTGRYAEDVRAAEKHWSSMGINSVPSIIINDRWLISGGQPADSFERALRNIAAELELTPAE